MRLPLIADVVTRPSLVVAPPNMLRTLPSAPANLNELFCFVFTSARSTGTARTSDASKTGTKRMRFIDDLRVTRVTYSNGA